MSQSYKGLKLKKEATLPHTSSGSEGTLWLNSSDNLLYLDGTPVSSYVGPTGPSMIDPSAQFYSVTNQTGAGYLSSKALLFDNTCLETSDSGAERTLTLANPITKDYSANNLVTHGSNGTFNFNDLYNFCGIRFYSDIGSNLYRLHLGGNESIFGGCYLTYNYDTGSGVQNLMAVDMNNSDKQIILGDNLVNNNYIRIDANGNMSFRANNSQTINIGTNGQVTIGNTSSNALVVSSSGSVTGYNGGNLKYIVDPNANFSFASTGSSTGCNLDGNAFNMGTATGRRARMNFNNGRFEFIRSDGQIVAFIDCESGEVSFGNNSISNSTFYFNPLTELGYIRRAVGNKFLTFFANVGGEIQSNWSEGVSIFNNVTYQGKSLFDYIIDEVASYFGF